MGKEEDSDSEEPQQPKEQPKKIIKKVPFKLQPKSKKNQQDNDLKDWKPMKIAQKITQQKQQIKKQQTNIAHNFLASLSQPKNTQAKEVKLNFDEKLLYRPKEKVVKKVEPTQQQIKWDIQDQTFIKKEFQQQNKQQIEHELVEDDEEVIEVDKIKWLNEEEKPKMKQIDITKTIDKNWKNQTVKKAEFQNQIWSSRLLKGKGQLSQFVKDAMKRFDDDELMINRQNLTKKNMKSRYGW